MAGRHRGRGRGRGRGYLPANDNLQESTGSNFSPAQFLAPRQVPYGKPHAYTRQSGRPHPFDGSRQVPYGKPHAYTRQSGQPHPFDGSYDDEEDEEEDDFRGHAKNNDNPLYELEDQESRTSSPTAPRQGRQSNNPLYGNDPFKPSPSATVCMTEFLRPKGRPPQESGQDPRHKLRPRSKKPRQLENSGNFNPINPSTDYEDALGTIRLSPPSPPRRAGGKGFFQDLAIWDQDRMRYPPERFSPVSPVSPPDSGQLVGSPKDKRIKESLQVATIPGQWPLPQPPKISDLIAAVRSDKMLLLGEVRKHANREPRVPGDLDRYFAPRKGDIIIHFTPTLYDNKLLEYYDERKSMLRLQPGDKLVRVKYDNYKLPDHLVITSKLYLYAPDWVYLGKALQTIKTV